jgi:hypothetical protein
MLHENLIAEQCGVRKFRQASSSMDLATRSLEEPNGFYPSSSTSSLTWGFGERLEISTTGVLPIKCMAQERIMV